MRVDCERSAWDEFVRMFSTDIVCLIFRGESEKAAHDPVKGQGIR